MSAIANLLDLHAAQQAMSKVFPTLDSLRWYLRQNREALMQAGAVLQITGKTWINACEFEKFILKRGREPRRSQSRSAA